MKYKLFAVFIIINMCILTNITYYIAQLPIKMFFIMEMFILPFILSYLLVIIISKLILHLLMHILKINYKIYAKEIIFYKKSSIHFFAHSFFQKSSTYFYCSVAITISEKNRYPPLTC